MTTLSSFCRFLLNSTTLSNPTKSTGFSVTNFPSGSPRSLRVMAPPPLLYAYHTLGVFRHHLWCLSTPPQCGIPTFMTSKLKWNFFRTLHDFGKQINQKMKKQYAHDFDFCKKWLVVFDICVWIIHLTYENEVYFDMLEEPATTGHPPPLTHHRAGTRQPAPDHTGKPVKDY